MSDAVWIAYPGGIERWDASLQLAWHVPTDEAIEPLVSPPMVGQLDDDPALEVAVAGERGVAWLDDDGRLLGTQPTHRAQPPLLVDGEVLVARQSIFGPAAPGRWRFSVGARAETSPIAADTDADGALEAIVVMHDVVAALRPSDGEVRWLVHLPKVPLDHRPDGERWGVRTKGRIAWSPEADCVLTATWSSNWRDDHALFCAGPDGVKWRHRLPGSGSQTGAVLADVDGQPGDEVLRRPRLRQP